MHFLWFYLKDCVYTDSPHNITEVNESIFREITAISVEMLNHTLHTMKHRALKCFHHHGDNLKDMILKS